MTQTLRRLSCAGLLAFSSLVALPAVAAPAPWWARAVIYEVYPRSFQDTDGNGVGDLDGIAARLPYLQRLGVDAIWIAPFYPRRRSISVTTSPTIARSIRNTERSPTSTG